MDKPFQRKGGKSNAHVGRAFEVATQAFFVTQGLPLQLGVKLPIGLSGLKPHSFDLGNLDEKVIVECKSHTWTEGGNVPSAKITTWNQAMYFFHVSPAGYRKIMFVLKAFSSKRNETLGRAVLHPNEQPPNTS
jgi:hypothetical protein